MGIKTNDKQVNYSYEPTQNKQQSWLMCGQSTFGAWMNHGHT
jgi:hypothetical protein